MPQMPKIVMAATAAKADGYKYMCSVVKSVYRTTYYHVVKIDDVIATGHWPAAPRGQFGNWHGAIGTSSLPDNCIRKDAAIARYC